MLDARTARRLALARGTRPVTIATGARTLPAAGARTVTLRPNARARRALARAGTVTATLRANATDRAGQRRSRSARLRLTR